MSKTVLAQVDGFTPVIDRLTQELGFVTSAVFGRIWRYCQGERGICDASLDTIGGELNMNRATIMRHARKLVQAGYLEDLTPDRRNRPHTYRDTGKAGLSLNLSASPGVAESNIRPAESPTVAVCNRGIADSNTGVAESHLKKGIKKQVREEEPAPEKNGRTRPAQSALQALFSELTGLPEPAPQSAKEKLAAAELWYQPIRRMESLANGTAAAILREAVARMRGRMTIASPKSVEKTFTAIVGERRVTPAAAPGRVYR